MGRRLPLLVAAAVVAAIALAVWPKRDAAPLLPDELEPYPFANALPEIHPPLEALDPATLHDPVRRVASRIEWGPPDVFYWTMRHLPAERTALAARLMERYEKVVVGSPFQAQRHVEALGQLGDESAIPLLSRIARQSPPEHEHLATAAIRGLAAFPRRPELEDLLMRLSGDPRRGVATVAMKAIVESGEFGTAEAVASFLEQYDGGDAIPFLQRAGARKLAGCADACARHLGSSHLLARQNAIWALLALGDPRGAEAALADLATGDDARVIETLTLWRDAAVLLPLDVARRLIDHPLGEVRKQLGVALGAGAGTRPDEAVDALLARLAADADPVVARVGAEQLWRRGRADAVQSWRDVIAAGYGTALREAVTFLCEQLNDPAVIPALRRRLDHEALGGIDQGNLLAGLKAYERPEDAGRFVARIVRAGGAEDLRAGERTFLSELAATYVQQLGGAAGAALADALEDAPTLRGRLALLDALRGVLGDAGADVQERTLELLERLTADPTQPAALRVAAADTFAFFDDVAVGRRLLALRERVDDAALAERITRLYAGFF